MIGGTGFIGSQVAIHFINKGCEVLSFSRNPPNKNIIKEINYIKGDLIEKKKLNEITKDIDLIFHCGSSSTPANLDSDADEEANTKNLVEAFFENNVKKLIFFSSGGAIYGNKISESSKETDEAKPVSKYGKTKLKIEEYLLEKFKNSKEKILILRPSNPYGPSHFNKKKQGVIPIFLRSINMNMPIEVYGDGSIIKDYIHINDLVEIIFNLSTGSNYGIYNIGSGIKTSINELIKILFKVTKRKSKIIYREPMHNDVNFFLCTDKVFTNQSHKKLINLEDGISKLWKDSYHKT